VLASGTLSFLPGDLAKDIPIVFTSLQTYGIIRVTLSNPANGRLSGVTRAFFVGPLNGPTEPPGLAWARFPDETVLYWSDGAANLLQAPSLVGPWNVVSNAPTPFVLAPSAPQQFFRLKR
jgi:hypothetical protein